MILFLSTNGSYDPIGFATASANSTTMTIIHNMSTIIYFQFPLGK